MISSKTRKSALASAIAMVIGVSSSPQPATADITLTFQNNATPSPTPLPFTAGSVPGASANLQFEADTEFRVVTPYGSGTNNGHKDAIFGGESWIFDNTGQMTAAENTDPNPGANQSAPMTSGLAGFPICAGGGTCSTIQRGASFLQTFNFFNFLAPIAGSVVADTYGVTTASIDLTDNALGIDFAVTHAQWADGNYIIGNDPNPGCTPASRGDVFAKGQGPMVNLSSSVTVTSAAGAADITFDFVLHGESTMTYDEVTVAGFCNNAVQWEFPGSGSIANQNPVAVDDGSDSPISVLTATATQVNVLANDNDPDWELLNSTAFDTLTVDGVGVCTNGGTLTDNSTNVIYESAPAYSGADSCTYTIADGRTGVSDPATVFLAVGAGNQPPTANDDGPGDTPGGPYRTNQGVAVSVDVLANDSDVDGDPMLVSRVDATSANDGAAVIINGGVEGGNNVTYTPASGFNGVDSFTYDNTDKDGTSTATVTIQVDSFAESSAGTVTISERVTAGDIGVPDPDTESSCVGSCFRIEVQDVPSGGQVEILLPELTAGYITGSEFRHFVTSTSSWKAHEAPDSVQTAPEEQDTGLCPGIPSGAWRTPAAGDTCVKYTLTDENGGGNGPNDDNSAATIILDPVGFGETAGAAVKQGSLSQNGCTLSSHSGGSWRNAGHWLLIAALLAFIRLFKKPS